MTKVVINDVELTEDEKTALWLALGIATAKMLERDENDEPFMKAAVPHILRIINLAKHDRNDGGGR